MMRTIVMKDYETTLKWHLTEQRRADALSTVKTSAKDTARVLERYALTAHVSTLQRLLYKNHNQFRREKHMQLARSISKALDRLSSTGMAPILSCCLIGW